MRLEGRDMERHLFISYCVDAMYIFLLSSSYKPLHQLQQQPLLFHDLTY